MYTKVYHYDFTIAMNIYQVSVYNKSTTSNRSISIVYPVCTTASFTCCPNGIGECSSIQKFKELNRPDYSRW